LFEVAVAINRVLRDQTGDKDTMLLSDSENTAYRLELGIDVDGLFIKHHIMAISVEVEAKAGGSIGDQQELDRLVLPVAEGFPNRNPLRFSSTSVYNSQFKVESLKTLLRALSGCAGSKW
jgi:hypothetical protein